MDHNIREESFTIDFAPLWLSSLHFVLPRPSNVCRYHLNGQNNKTIHLDLHPPAEIKDKHRTIIILPGCGGNSVDMVNIARRFSREGYLAWTVDYAVGDVCREDFDDYTISELIVEIKVIIDFVCEHELVDKQHIYIAGHSFGGFSSVLYLARSHDPRITAVIGICPVFDVVEIGFNHFYRLADKFSSWGRLLKLIVKKAKNKIIKLAFFIWGATGKLLVIKKNGHWMRLTRKFMDDIVKVNNHDAVLRDIARVDQPCLFLYGENDPWISVSNVKEVYKDLSAGRKAIGVLEKEGHLPIDELGAEEICERTISWLEHNYSLAPR
ncbi:MAG: alpha/beta hydrolase [Candidatus Margulisbacteria bacterium]|nr:alpha/beta hydrolase [Candidatus Margulisiibacteriota bacterium]MBU1616740.1 alpha/beta hydrolase [Candidatus Margulisiibacteriota bacterium]